MHATIYVWEDEKEYANQEKWHKVKVINTSLIYPFFAIPFCVCNSQSRLLNSRTLFCHCLFESILFSLFFLSFLYYSVVEMFYHHRWKRRFNFYFVCFARLCVCVCATAVNVLFSSMERCLLFSFFFTVINELQYPIGALFVPFNEIFFRLPH